MGASRICAAAAARLLSGGNRPRRTCQGSALTTVACRVSKALSVGQLDFAQAPGGVEDAGRSLAPGLQAE